MEQQKNEFKFYGMLECCAKFSVKKISDIQCEVIQNIDSLLIQGNESSEISYTVDGNHIETFISELKILSKEQQKFWKRIREEFEAHKEEEYPDQGFLQELYNLINDPCYDSYFVGDENVRLKYTGELSLENGISYDFKLNKVGADYMLVATSKTATESITFSSSQNPTQAFYSGFDELITKIEEWLGQPSKGESK